MRLDSYVAKEWPEHSRSTWQKLIQNGNVSVNGSIETSSKRVVTEEDEVTAVQPEEVNHDNSSLPVLYEDDNLIVIDKPLGVLTHSKGALNDEFTVAEFVRSKTSYKSDTNRPGIVHRLDRATSGVIICAKNDETASMLQRQFTNRTVKKKYVAVLDGTLKEPEAVVDLPIGRNPSAPSTFRVDPNGKQATTAYTVLRQSTVHTLVELRPKTGRTHQLRVHMAYLNAPIVGDRVYGKKEADRMYLHAHELEITIPEGKRMVFTSRLPDSFAKQVQE
jgi:23S rRNA pseudouridine1911/1915/1917 synthase